MKHVLKNVLRDWLPPVITRRLSRTHSQSTEPLRYQPGGWDDARFPGWNVQSVLDHYMAVWPEMMTVSGAAAPFGRMLAADSVDANLLALTYAYAVSLAAQGRSRLSMLDWGGAIGYYRFIAEAAVPGVIVDYACKDVPLLAEAGQRLSPSARFFSDDSFAAERFDLVIASGSFQYTRDWPEEMKRLTSCTSCYLLITRLPTHDDAADFFYSQRAYGSAWLSWSINRSNLCRHAASYGLELVREFVVAAEDTEIAHAPAPSRLRGFLFHRATNCCTER